ncbi:leucyl aminopeptidase [Anaplasmataceae bacterium AB001_6]|nr:leucyl aminopeptidase [Anaplasmataceae bacterium AB001_6]
MSVEIPKISFDNSLSSIQNRQGVLVVPVYEGCEVSAKLENLDIMNGGMILNKLQNSSVFKGKKSDTMLMVLDGKDGNLMEIMFVGIGSQKKLDAVEEEKIGAILARAISNKKLDDASVLIPFVSVSSTCNLIQGMMLKSYVFDKYSTDEEIFKIRSINFIVDDPVNVEKTFARDFVPIIEAYYVAQDLIMMPGNELYPETFVNICKDLFKNINGKLKIEILDEKIMQKMGMNALLAVGQGSSKPSRLLVIRWHGKTSEEVFDVAFVGKGITFDSGGISIKPSNRMWEMKADMSGAAVLTGLMYTLAHRDAKANVMAVLALAENAVGGNAQRPGDIVQSMSGKTIEVLNTDAEGRLILADALWFAQSYKINTIVDIATLTGAICVALGNVHAGLFSNDAKTADNLLNASKETNERIWQLPMGKEHDGLLTSDCADIKNIETKRVAGGSIIAAKFLEFFIKEDIKWAHLDIAGVTDYHDEITPKKSYYAFGIKLLNKYVLNSFES